MACLDVAVPAAGGCEGCAALGVETWRPIPSSAAGSRIDLLLASHLHGSFVIIWLKRSSDAPEWTWENGLLYEQCQHRRDECLLQQRS